jgi:hypothetical protein
MMRVFSSHRESITTELRAGWPEEEDRLFSTVWPLPAYLQKDRQGSGDPQQ